LLRGAENRMGYVSQRNQPLRLGVINQLLRAIKKEVEEQNAWVFGTYFGCCTGIGGLVENVR
jgi:hypothetical protein